jgi:hypothetical protein
MAQANGRGFFRNAVEALIEARTRQADRYVKGVLLMLDDDTLQANGYGSRKDLHKSATPIRR